MQAKMVLLAGVALLGLSAFESRAATFNPPSPGSVDFGVVPNGTTSTLDFEVSWSEDGNEPPFDYLAFPNFASSVTPLSFKLNSCILTRPDYSDGRCNYTITFAPQSAGLYKLFFAGLIQLRRNDVPIGFFSFTASGASATPVPLPAALPLLVSGLGALGVISWRRRRKLAQA